MSKYHSLFPLDEPNKEKLSKLFGVATSVYKATCSTDGLPYVLRRLEGVRLLDHALELADGWVRHVRHSGVVALREMFVSKDWAEAPGMLSFSLLRMCSMHARLSNACVDVSAAVYMVYDFHPGAVTLESKFLHATSQPLPEPVLWSVLVQLVAALKAYARHFHTHCEF